MPKPANPLIPQFCAALIAVRDGAATVTVAGITLSPPSRDAAPSVRGPSARARFPHVMFDSWNGAVFSSCLKGRSQGGAALNVSRSGVRAEAARLARMVEDRERASAECMKRWEGHWERSQRRAA